MSSPDDATTRAASRADLMNATVSGLRWVGGARVVAEIVGFGSVIAIAHLVPPAEFGRAAVAVMVGDIAQSLTVQGLGAPLVQRADLGIAHIRVAFLLSLAVGVLMGVLTFAAAPFVVDPVLGPRIAELVQLAAPAFVLAGLMAVPMALLQRRLTFRRLALVEACAALSAAATAVGLALAGLDGEAIVGGMLAMLGVSAIGLFLSARPGRPAWHRRESAELLRFGAPTTGTGLLYFVTRNVDYLLIAARIGATDLGYYVRAYQLGSDYQQKISGVMLRLALPVFSRTADLADMRRVRARMTRLHAIAIFPLLALLVCTAPVLVPWMFGARWAPAAEPAQILAVAGFVAALGTGTGPLLIAAGRPDALLKYTAGALVALAGAVYVAAPYGLIAVCVTVAVVKVLSLLMLLGGVVRPIIGIPLRETLIGDAGPPLVACLALAAVALPVRIALDAAGAPAPLLLAAAGLAGGAAYLAVLRAAFPASWADLVLLIRRLVGDRRPLLPRRKRVAG